MRAYRIHADPAIWNGDPAFDVCDAEFAKVPAGWIQQQANEREERAARGKLRGYFRRIGFERVGRTRFYGLSMARVVPTLAELIRPGA